jgi:hypothetical protein
MLKTCPYSGTKFQPKRRDQVFATPLNRMRYHNDIAASVRRAKGPIDKALERNFLIMSKLINQGETKTFDREYLDGQGYNSAYFTHLDNHNGKFAVCLYHFIIPKTDNPNTLTVIYPKNND